ncbi:MAG: hypothetical protein IPP74_00545 [Alphaproteobacteria bacterium]|nr:hypothetical protein [Alphaproteobacteria bacterium]
MASLRLLICLGILLQLIACKPVPLWIGKTPTNADPMFNMGWKDGCESGLASVSNSFYKTFYKFRQQAHLIENNTYYGAWFDSFRYCRDYTDKWTFESWDRAENTDPNQKPLYQGVGDFLLFTPPLHYETPYAFGGIKSFWN